MIQAQMIQEINWQVDLKASKIEFRIRHLLSYLTGVFSDYSMEVTTQGENFSTAQVRFYGILSSAVIGDEERRRQISSIGLLREEKYALVQFDSMRIEKISEHRFSVHGYLQLFGVQQPLTMEMNFDGLTRTPGDHLSTAFALAGKFKYTDFTEGIDELKAAPLFVGKEVALMVRVKLEKPFNAAMAVADSK